MKTKILLFSSIIFLAACTSKPKDPKAQLADLKKQQADIATQIQALEAKSGTKDAVKLTDVSTVEVKAQSFTNYVQLQGKIDAPDNLYATSQAGGIITGLFVKTGDHVSKGRLLAQLDNSVLKQPGRYCFSTPKKPVGPKNWYRGAVFASASQYAECAKAGCGVKTTVGYVPYRIPN
jgi:biotin carboxyl carrier protein